jgi:hypothetical protein
MTIDELETALNKIIPGCGIEYDNDGQIIIYTGTQVVENRIIPMGENPDDFFVVFDDGTYIDMKYAEIWVNACMQDDGSKVFRDEGTICYSIARMYNYLAANDLLEISQHILKAEQP